MAFQISDEMDREIRKIAELEERSKSFIIRRAIKKFLEVQNAGERD